VALPASKDHVNPLDTGSIVVRTRGRVVLHFRRWHGAGQQSLWAGTKSSRSGFGFRLLSRFS